MKKSKLYGIVPVVLVAAATASPAYSNDRCAFSGFYTGIAIGDSVTTGHARATDSVTERVGGTTFVDSRSVRAGLKKNAFVGEIHAGYGEAWDCLYLGGEIFFKGGRVRARNTVSDSSTETVGALTINTSITETTSARLRSGEFGIDFRPGVLVNPSSLLYARVGVGFNRLSINRRTTLSASIPGVGSASVAGNVINRHKNVAALRLGAGLETEICANWTIRADYAYTRYRKAHHAVSSSVVNPVLGTLAVSSNSHVSLNNHTMMLGASYYW
jgi:opacity protein-like surface antigen